MHQKTNPSIVPELFTNHFKYITFIHLFVLITIVISNNDLPSWKSVKLEDPEILTTFLL